MTGIGTQFLISNLPILLGALLLLLMLKINPLAKKYILTNHPQTSNDLIIKKIENGNYALQEHLKSQLIVNGISPAYDQDVENIAFEKLGFISLNQICALNKNEKKSPKNLILISQDLSLEKLQLLQLSYSRSLGLVLPYLLDFNLKAVII